VNSFHVTDRIPPEILNIVCSHLTTEDDVFSMSQVCRHWRGVLISSPSLWTQLPCHRVARTIASLERCKSMPIQLEVGQRSPKVALESVLLCENKISSLAIHPRPDTIPLLNQLFMFAKPSVERLHIFSGSLRGWMIPGEETAHEIWSGLPFLRELFISLYTIPIGRLSAPNLAHLALEQTGYLQNVTTRSLLDVLRACPLLETLLIADSSFQGGPAHDSTPVSLPHLRSIELGMFEVRSELITHLRFPSNVAAGFRTLYLTDVRGDIPPTVVAAMHHVLRKVDIGRITLAVPPLNRGVLELFIRFEGPQGSLELTIRDVHTDDQLWDVFFGLGGVLFSHSPQIGNVRELHIVGCSFRGSREMYHVNAAMPNITSISFFHCEGHVFGLLIPTNPPSPPFPHLERVMVLGSESELAEIVESRSDLGVPLKTLVIGRLPEGFVYDLEDDTDADEFEYIRLEDYTELEEFVEDLRVGCPTEILEWGAENEILNVWSMGGIPGPVSSNVKLVVQG